MTDHQKQALVALSMCLVATFIVTCYNAYRIVHATSFRFFMIYLLLLMVNGVLFSLMKFLMDIVEGKDGS